MLFMRHAYDRIEYRLKLQFTHVHASPVRTFKSVKIEPTISATANSLGESKFKLPFDRLLI